MKYKPANICLAITGASGIQYALRLLQCLVEAGETVYLLVSAPAQIVTDMETELELPARPHDMQLYLTSLYNAAPDQIQVFGKEEWTAPVASGSGAPRSMVVCPCTTGTLSAIACGSSNNLIERAADVMLKERKNLILVPRESPFSEIHLENMLKLARMGATILPPNPGFYYQPKNVQDIIDFVVAKILDHLNVEHQLLPRWGVQE